MIIHTLDNTPLALSAQIFGSAPPVTITVAGHTAETNVGRIARGLVALNQPSPPRGANKILAAIGTAMARLFGRERRVDRCIHLWYTLPENSLNGEAQMRRLFIESPNVSWGPLIRITDRPDINATLVRLVAAWRA